LCFITQFCLVMPDSALLQLVYLTVRAWNTQWA